MAGVEVRAARRATRHNAAGLAAAPDPLEAELFVSGVLAMWHPDMPDDAEPLDTTHLTVIAPAGLVGRLRAVV